MKNLSLFLGVLFVKFALCSAWYGRSCLYPYNTCSKIADHLEEYKKVLEENVCTCKKNAVPCPDGYERHEDKCYWFAPLDTRASFEEARTICRENGSYLAIITTLSEGQFIRNYLNVHPINEAYYLAINDIADEGNFIWTRNDNGSIPVTYTDWDTLQPDDSQGNEDCGEIRRLYHFHWNDRPCADRIAFICMKDLVMPSC